MTFIYLFILLLFWPGQHYFSPESFPSWGVIPTTHVDGKYPKILFVSQSWIFLVKSSNMEIFGASEMPRLISIGMLNTCDNYVV